MSKGDIDRIIGMAWIKRTPFEAITYQFSIFGQEVVNPMGLEMTPNGFKTWHQVAEVRAITHQKLRTPAQGHFKCSGQNQITQNAITKR
ncbi:DUF2805 domain-containing protein [Arenibacter sp. M-2]|uniref:DUF2805 domain-containing protein n=1 Tax=Arenibacter sp. M-2 TaxID=3053612 RepID=UPI00257103FD|nr:DUF2805 domain-containing protein [Arenibacter sp. M-2]MDL5513059.1 DUF2805 domain-containing protein [Arenibacter sp. M-2]